MGVDRSVEVLFRDHLAIQNPAWPWGVVVQKSFRLPKVLKTLVELYPESKCLLCDAHVPIGYPINIEPFVTYGTRVIRNIQFYSRLTMFSHQIVSS